MQYFILFMYLFLTSLLEYNCFTMVCLFLPYNKVNQPYIYIRSHVRCKREETLASPSLPPSLSHPSRWSQSTELIPCAMRLLPTSYPPYVWSCIYVHATLSLCHILPFPLPISSSPFSSRSVPLFPSYH